jgi:GGDEF domain-containing protein
MGFSYISGHLSGSQALIALSTRLSCVLPRGWVRGLVLVWVLGLLGSSALSRPIQELNNQKQPNPLAAAAEYWIDASLTLGPEQVATRNDLDWKSTPDRGIYPLKPQQALWVRFTVSPPADRENWLVEIPYPALDRASLYTSDNAGQWTEQRAGDLTPVNQWTTPHRYPLMLLRFNADAPTQYLLRIENAQGFSAPIRFVSARYVLREEQRVSIFLGAYFGMALLGCLVGVVGVLWLRDSAYFSYGLCALLIGLEQAVSSGVAGLLLWPNSAYWADRSLVVLGTLVLVVFLQLNATVVYLAQRSRRLNALVLTVALAGLVLCAALLVTPSAIRLSLTVPYMLLVLVLVVTTNLWAWRHGDRFSGWLLLSSTPFALGLSVAVARYLQWVPLSFATEHGVMASMAFQLMSLLAVLAVRSQHRRENRRRIQGLYRVDPATGLINEHVFAERLGRMIARSERLKNQSAVMLIDIVNADQTQRDFGRNAAEELPLRVAARLLSTAREIDSAARLSERRFGMLVEGPFSATDAATLGPRIVARCLMSYKGLHADCVAQVRVAYALVPEQGANAHSLLRRLEERLACASSDDKRAVYNLADAAPPTKRPRERRETGLAPG